MRFFGVRVAVYSVWLTACQSDKLPAGVEMVGKLASASLKTKRTVAVALALSTLALAASSMWTLALGGPLSMRQLCAFSVVALVLPAASDWRTSTWAALYTPAGSAKLVPVPAFQCAPPSTLYDQLALGSRPATRTSPTEVTPSVWSQPVSLAKAKVGAMGALLSTKMSPVRTPRTWVSRFRPVFLPTKLAPMGSMPTIWMSLPSPRWGASTRNSSWLVPLPLTKLAWAGASLMSTFSSGLPCTLMASLRLTTRSMGSPPCSSRSACAAAATPITMGTSTTLNCKVVSWPKPAKSVALMRTVWAAPVWVVKPVMTPSALMCRPSGRPVASKRKRSLASTSAKAGATLSSNNWPM